MIKIAIRSEIINYCYKEKLQNISEMDSFPIAQVVLLRRKTEKANNEMLKYLKQIEALSLYLIDVLVILSHLSKVVKYPYENSIPENQLNQIISIDDMQHSTIKDLKDFQKNIFLDVEKLTFSFIEKYKDFAGKDIINICNQISSEYKKLINDFKNRSSNPSENKNKFSFLINDFIDNLKDFFIDSKILWVEHFYNEFKKYCKINNNLNYYFVFENDLSNSLKQTLIDTGDYHQKLILDKLINEFKQLLIDIKNIIIEPKVKRNKENNIDNKNYIYFLYKKFYELEHLVKILKFTFTDKGSTNKDNQKYYLSENKEKNILEWNDSKVLLSAILIHVLGKKIVKVKRKSNVLNKKVYKEDWKEIFKAFNQGNFIDDVRQFLKKPSDIIKDKLDILMNSMKNTCDDQSELIKDYRQIEKSIKDNKIN